MRAQYQTSEVTLLNRWGHSPKLTGAPNWWSHSLISTANSSVQCSDLIMRLEYWTNEATELNWQMESFFCCSRRVCSVKRCWQPCLCLSPLFICLWCSALMDAWLHSIWHIKPTKFKRLMQHNHPLETSGPHHSFPFQVLFVGWQPILNFAFLLFFVSLQW